MSNFGAGQGLFGTASNQNKNQTSSTPGAAPAAGASPFANMGANTTNSSVFGGAGPGAGAGNTPGIGGTNSGTTGSLFGTSGSAFGGGGGGNPGATAGAGTGTGTASPFSGGGPFGGVHASYSLFMELSHLNYHLARPATTTAATGAATGGSLFPSASSNTGTSGTTSGGLFGNNPSTNTATTGGTRKPNTHEFGFLYMNSFCCFQVLSQAFLNLRPLAGVSSGQEDSQVLLALAEVVQLVVAYFLVQQMRRVGQRCPVQPAAPRQRPLPVQIPSLEAFSRVPKQLIALRSPQLLPVSAQLRQREVVSTYESQSLALRQRQGPLQVRLQQVTHSLLPKQTMV